MVERSLLLAGRGVDEHEFVAASDRAPINEAAGLFDPCRRFGHSGEEPVVAPLQTGGAIVIGACDLGGNDRRFQQQRDHCRGAGKLSACHSVSLSSEAFTQTDDRSMATVG